MAETRAARSNGLRVLCVDEGGALARRLAPDLRACIGSARLTSVATEADLVGALERERWDAVVVGSDAAIPLERAAALVRSRDPDTPLLAGSAAGIQRSLRQLRASMEHRREELVRTRNELRAREEQLRHAQKMEVIGNFAGGIAHDFNNIVMSIAGYAAMVLQDWPRGQAGREDIEEIVRSSEQAQALTRQLLGFARKETPEPRRLHLAEVIRDVDQLLRRSAGQRVRLAVRIEPEASPVRVDANQIQQVLLNLVLNARDAMPAGGEIRIDVADVTLLEPVEGVAGDVPAGHWVWLGVHDTGAGMDAETQRRALEPFFTTKAAGRGTGLGLAIVNDVLQRAGAHLRLTSAPGTGTAFDIYFPADLTAARKRPPGSDEEARTILLVEDEPALVALVSRLLEREGYLVHTAANAEQAIEIARRSSPIHLLLTDVVLPGRNGRELAEVLAKMRPGTPTLFMSGYADDVIERAGLDMGRARILDKPFKPEDLYECVREAMAGSGVGR